MRILATVALVLIALLTFVLLFTDFIVRIFAGHKRIPSPVPLAHPDACIIESDFLMRIVRFIGRITGGAKNPRACTVGLTIIVGEATLDDETFLHVIEHENVHVEQRVREGRTWLARYIIEHIVADGYSNNKYEREAYGRDKQH